MTNPKVTLVIGDNVVSEELESKTFSTGSKGFRSSFRMSAGNGVKYMVSVQLVEIGSKPKPEENTKSKK